jgi:hypothetical protein
VAEAGLDAVDGDEALRWLEKLAAQQGARPDELLTTPEERLAETPAWIAAQQPPLEPPAMAEERPIAEEIAAGPAPAETFAREEPAAEALPDWLRAEPVAPEAMAAPTPPETALEPPAAAPEAAPEITPDTPAWLAAVLAGTSAAAAALTTEPEPAEPAPEAQPAEAPPLDTWLSQMEQAMPVETLAATAPGQRQPPAGEAEGGFVAEFPVEAAVPEAADLSQPLAEASAGQPDQESDEALRWLESLAAKQGASADELLTAPEERPAETPAWIAALQAAPADAAPPVPPSEAVPPEISMPDWLRPEPAAAAAEPSPAQPATGEAELPILTEPASLAELAASVPAEPPGFVTIVPETPPVPPVAVEDMGEDEALRWLEGLAAQQGARPEELLSAPEDRPAEAPAWVAAEAGTAAEVPAEVVRPDWLPAEAAAPEAAASLASEVVPSGEPGMPAAAAGETQAWQEGPATTSAASPDEFISEQLRQSAAELLAAAELQAAVEPEPLVEPEPAAVAPPDWISAAEAGPSPAEPQPPAETPEAAAEAPADLERLSRLSERLAAARRAKEIEIEERFAAQRAQQEAARREVQERMESWRQAVEAGPAPEPETPAAAPPAPVPVEAEALVTPTEAPGQPDYASAVERYAPQVEAGDDLDAAVRALESLAASPQAPAPVLRVLGDAYVKRDQLQAALDAYRRALSRL